MWRRRWIARYRPDVRKFLEALAETGDVPVPAWASAVVSESVEIDDLVRAADSEARLDAPGDAPPLEPEAARWAARILFRACCCLADRTVDAAAVAKSLGDRGPDGRSASVCWSVDLFVRHLPALHRLARGLAPGDPLVAALERLGAEWPLSSVGMSGGPEGAIPPEAVAEDPCLRRLHADRVLRESATGRLADLRIAESVRAALGAHGELAPTVAAALRGGVESADA